MLTIPRVRCLLVTRRCLGSGIFAVCVGAARTMHNDRVIGSGAWREEVCACMQIRSGTPAALSRIDEELDEASVTRILLQKSHCQDVKTG